MMFDTAAVISPGTVMLRVIAGFLAGLVVGMIIMRRTVRKLTSHSSEQEVEQSHAVAGSHL